ncbi:MAG TPA: universal stress protein [Nitrososphaeraceae archaeon]|jgi:Universal stress protein UspA and related nucleotide-binding proteins
MLKKILVTYDTSKPSENALTFALTFAKELREKREIIVLYVLPEAPYPLHLSQRKILKSEKTDELITFEQYMKDLSKQMRLESKKMLEKKVKEIESFDNIRFRTEVIYGDPAREIINYSASNQIDLIIIGNTGLKGFSKIKSLGSVSRSVIENAKVPVIVVH